MKRILPVTPDVFAEATNGERYWQAGDLAGKSQRVKMPKALNHFKCGQPRACQTAGYYNSYEPNGRRTNDSSIYDFLRLTS
jgi:hypothetical protein